MNCNRFRVTTNGEFEPLEFRLPWTEDDQALTTMLLSQEDKGIDVCGWLLRYVHSGWNVACERDPPVTNEERFAANDFFAQVRLAIDAWEDVCSVWHPKPEALARA
jgi:hypothetical protein